MTNKMKMVLSTVVLGAVVAICSVFASTGGGDEVTHEGKDARAYAGKEADVQSLLDVKGYDGLRLERKSYKVLYSKEWRLPVAVAWQLTREHVSGRFQRSKMQFTEDKAVPAPRATWHDYASSGYSRGHMCPAGDNKWDEEALRQTFLLTNICPQMYELNAGDWNDLEKQCRTWARRYGEVYIVCGPILLNKVHRTIGRNKVVVPEAFYKVVLRMDASGKDGTGIGFIYRNENVNKKMTSYVNSIDDVERITGLDFFSALPDKIENAAEKKCNLNEW